MVQKEIIVIAKKKTKGNNCLSEKKKVKEIIEYNNLGV